MEEEKWEGLDGEEKGSKGRGEGEGREDLRGGLWERSGEVGGASKHLWT